MIYSLFILLILCSLQNLYTSADAIDKTDSNGQELLLCRKCGADVADSSYLFSVSSPGAEKVEKQHLFGRKNITVQTLINPFGITFDIVTAEKARCENVGPPQRADSWFPEYTWRICSCPHCGHHLGWTFESVPDKGANNDQPKSFHGIILGNVLGENFTDSLIMMPMTYQM
ncbi:protein cereblon-like isoform X2 [Hyposmocoma kahamanoa]|uniref:protein cereblon-like isoform X2 n=1 Tax=Hyposmocoma kahamanoa TaxID=1477025 RepID=UPI000E6D963E|nr:protein cereblon-like isoform X2 [Hyposmocoma kahamanoa]